MADRSDQSGEVALTTANAGNTDSPVDPSMQTAPGTLPMGNTPPFEEKWPEITGYEISGRIGSGGMGTVYRAQQLSTNREVALKVMRADVTESERCRDLFTREVRLAARLQHLNVVRVYDSGLHCGLYYYAMELIEGQTLDSYALAVHRNALGPTTYSPSLPRRQILELMRLVCQGVHHAHLRGVIHRDLKPRNIVVSADGQPHVLDFGLATLALQQQINDSSTPCIKTAEAPRRAAPDDRARSAHDFAGTPAFMSPEQTRGRIDELDIRTDVYSLGVTLYLLLTGQMPRELSGGRSTVMRKVAHGPIVAPLEVDGKMDRELAALLLKAMAPDRENRYESAGAMADDLGRFLQGRPLLAIGQSPVYVARKWIGRHRRPMIIALCVFAAMLGLGINSYLSHRGLRRAQEQRAGFANSLNHLFAEMIPLMAVRQVTDRDVLNRSANDAIRIFKDFPGELARMLDLIGVALKDQGWCTDAETRIQQAVDMQLQTTGKQDLDSIRMINDLAEVKRDVGKSSESAALSQRAATLATHVNGSNDQLLRAKLQQAWALDDQGKLEDAAVAANEALEFSRNLHGGAMNNPEVLRARNTLAFVLRDQNNLDQAIVEAREVFKARTEVLGESHPDTIRTMEVYATTLDLLGNTGEAKIMITDAARLSVSTSGLGHADQFSLEGDRGTILCHDGDFAGAVQGLTQALGSSRRLLGDEDRSSLMLMRNLADVEIAWADQLDAPPPLKRKKLRKEADQLLNRVIDFRNQASRIDDPSLLDLKDALARLETEEGQLGDAEKRFRYTLDVRQERLGDMNPALVKPIYSLARVLQFQGKWSDAEQFYRKIWNIRKLDRGPQSPEAEAALKDLNNAIDNQNKSSGQ